MAAEMQLRVLFGRKSHDHPEFREEKKQKCRVFFDVIFDVYTPVETQTMQTADCRLQTVQTVQTVQTECYLFFFFTCTLIF